MLLYTILKYKKIKERCRKLKKKKSNFPNFLYFPKIISTLKSQIFKNGIDYKFSRENDAPFEWKLHFVNRLANFYSIKSVKL